LMPSNASTSAALPPGPDYVATFGFVRNPYRFLDRCAKRFGDWFTVRVPGVSPFVFTSDPNAIREIFLGDANLLHAGEANRPLGAFMGERSVLFLDGAAHLHDRRMLLPAFNGDRMRAYGPIMREVTRDAIAKWPTGERFAVYPSLRAITFGVIMRAVFGLDETGESARVRELITRLFALYSGRFGSLFQLPAMQINLGPLSPWGRVVRLNRQMEAELFAEFARCRAAVNDGRADILSMLLRARDERGEPLSDRVLRDEMMTLLLAGYETTAASLAWAMHQLSQHPEAAQRAREELAHLPNDVEPSSMHYLDAVINESIRLCPVVPNIGRVLKAPLKIADHELPKGVTLAPCIYLVHRRAELWPEPERFDPTRFIDARPNPYAFFPFGGGPRRCLGAAFATYQMKIVLAEVLRRFEIAPVAGYVPRPTRVSIAIGPSKGMPVILKARAA
ncbi:MAG TPA: cytochrome P450, partial [Candidatus Binataceae bacterium]|nr:cytochrome P450 [Candidatus Binataceae bacterium]